MYSTEGYRRNSPDRNNPYNIIPSGNISMKGVDHPVLGIDEYGNMQWMIPNREYQFKGNNVLEIPYMQQGGITIPPIDGDIKADIQPVNIYDNYFVDSSNDPKYRAYQDSLNLYNSNQHKGKISSNDIWSNKDKNDFLSYNTTLYKTIYDKNKIKDYSNTSDVYHKIPINDRMYKPVAIGYQNLLVNNEYLNADHSRKNVDIYVEKTGKGPTNDYIEIREYSANYPYIFHNTISPIAWLDSPIYAKPEQPVFVKGTQRAMDAEKQIMLKEQGLYTGEIDGNWGPLSKDAWAKYESMQQTKPVEEVKVKQSVQQQPQEYYKNVRGTIQKTTADDPYAMTYEEAIQKNNPQKTSSGNVWGYTMPPVTTAQDRALYFQHGGTAGMDGMIKARLAIDSHFSNPTARRMTNYDTRSYEFPDGNKGNVYVSSYDNLVTPQIQDVNGKLQFIDQPWADANADRSYEQSMKFEREEDARYFGENYKKYAPMMNLYKKQEGGEMNETIIKKIQEALQQGVTPEQLVKELQKQGVSEQEAIQMVSAAMPQQEQMQQYQYGTTVRHNYADNINFDNKFNATALGLNAISDPRNMTWALPDTGFGSGIKAISGLASGLAGSYLGYAKMFSKDKVTNNTPTATIGKNPNAQIQASYMGTDSEKELSNKIPISQGAFSMIPGTENPLYNGNPNIQGTNQYSTYQKGGPKYGLNAYSKIQKETLDNALKEKKISQTDYEIIKHHKSGLIKPYKDGWEYDKQNMHRSPNIEGLTDEQNFFLDWYNDPITVNKYDKFKLPNFMDINKDVISNNIKTLNIKPNPDIPKLYINNLGAYNPHYHQIYGMETARAHEVSHGSKVAFFPINQALLEGIIEKETHTKDPDNYYTSPDEIYARINSLRYKYKLKPGQTVTKEFLEKQLWQEELNDLRKHFTEKGVLRLFNELAQNNNKTSSNLQYAQQGGMKKYQPGGPKELEIDMPYIPYNEFLNPTPAARQHQPYNYTVPGKMGESAGQPVYNPSYNNTSENYKYNEDYGRYKQYLDNFAQQDFSQFSKQEQTKPEDNSTITSMNDDALGFMIANNALVGFQNFNDVLSARDYEKEYNQMLMKTGNSDQRYNPINPTNPYGMYTPNVGIGSNYGLVANSHIQDFGTGMASAKCGGTKKKYQEGGEYNLTQEEIDYILKNGGEIEMID